MGVRRSVGKSVVESLFIHGVMLAELPFSGALVKRTTKPDSERSLVDSIGLREYFIESYQ